jgi:hypothetical protein
MKTQLITVLPGYRHYKRGQRIVRLSGGVAFNLYFAVLIVGCAS